MKRILNQLTLFAMAFVLLAAPAASSVAHAESGYDGALYRVTIQNLTSGQPFSPPVAATHRSSISMFEVGGLASTQLEAIAEDGNQIPMFDLLDGARGVGEAVDVGRPLTPNGVVIGSFTDSASFTIQAEPGMVLSLTTMLICTNDGFTGLNGAALPAEGSAVYLLNGYDAGTEDNTEASGDIVDPCSALGPAPLAGDPNGNDNAGVDTNPQAQIAHHPNITGGGDLSAADHGWTDPVAKVTIVRVEAGANRFSAALSGAGEIPSVDTDAVGSAEFRLIDGGTGLRFALEARAIDGVTQAHIHIGPPNETGPVVAFLFGPVPPTGPLSGRFARGVITEADLLGPLAGDFDAFVEALRAGDLYVNVHTTAYPDGEIRGQIGAAGQ